MEDPKLSQCHLLTDEVNVDLDVLRAPMMNWIRCHVDCTHVVIEDNRGRGEGNVEFLQQLADPTALGNSMSNNPILGLSARLGHSGLALGRPRNQVVAEEDAEAGGRASRVRTPSPIRI
jgi:hypothetical protein